MSVSNTGRINIWIWIFKSSGDDSCL